MSNFLAVSTIGSALFGIIVFIISVIAFWKIFSKAGFSPWMSLLMLVPVINFIAFLYLAFADWPALKGQSQQLEHQPLE
ncbi:hypothetical protein H1S01_17285 [Heliobacterium chlorum]|uniref:Uncharacterized protein n=2 Tax=Heliobacterium chlorum TaxID=2698 RepID=A0ABR7T8I1_HELCL|nr:hypothetical protein [Heliobacterium chlorum]